MAQSTVTLFGGADINFRNVKSGVNSFTGLAQDGIYSSRFGVQGVEDLGGGLKAGFHFEGGMNPDTGTPGGLTFTRKSTLGVMGGFGEVRLGRDYTPTFTVHGIADPFGTNGVGSFLNIAGSTVVSDGSALSADEVLLATGSFSAADRGTERRTDASGLRASARTDARLTLADPNAVRANNSVTYYTPNFSGFSAAVMYSFGAENTYSLKKTGDMTSFNVRYDAGPISVGFGNQQTQGGLTAAAAGFAASSATANAATTAVIGTDNQKWTTNLLAASYDLGVAKLSFMHRSDKLGGGGEAAKAEVNMIGATVPMGATVLRASYATKKASIDGVGSTSAGKQLAVGAIYSLSKRTSLYGTYATLNNNQGFANNVGSAAANSDNTSHGFEFGVKHNF